MKESWMVDGRSSVFQLHGGDRDVMRSQRLCEWQEGGQRVMVQEGRILLWGLVGLCEA